MLLPLNLTPSTRSILERTCGDGIALPFSYSCTVCSFSLILVANSFCLRPNAALACMIAWQTEGWTFLTVGKSSSRTFLVGSCAGMNFLGRVFGSGFFLRIIGPQ